MQVLKLSEYVRRCLVIQGTWIPASLEGKPDIDLYDAEQLGEPLAREHEDIASDGPVLG